MSAPRKYDQEFRDRAVRMYRDRLAEPGESKLSARRNVGSLLDLNQATLRDVNGGRKLTPFRHSKIDPLGGHGSSVVDAGTRPRSRSLSR